MWVLVRRLCILLDASSSHDEDIWNATLKCDDVHGNRSFRRVSYICCCGQLFSRQHAWMAPAISFSEVFFAGSSHFFCLVAARPMIARDRRQEEASHASSTRGY